MRRPAPESGQSTSEVASALRIGPASTSCIVSSIPLDGHSTANGRAPGGGRRQGQGSAAPPPSPPPLLREDRRGPVGPLPPPASPGPHRPPSTVVAFLPSAN